jgi:hypothetical protein
VDWAEREGIISNRSVEIGDINENLPTQTIRRIIRDEYLMDSDLTILLCGLETRFRKHVDWEIKSSMIDGQKNRRSGVLVIDLPTSRANSWHAAFSREKEIVYPDYTGGWRSVASVSEFEDMYPDLPRRILENLMAPNVKISIVPWERVYGYSDRFRFLVEASAVAGKTNAYDTSRPMRMKNYNPSLEFFDARL